MLPCKEFPHASPGRTSTSTASLWHFDPTYQLSRELGFSREEKYTSLVPPCPQLLSACDKWRGMETCPLHGVLLPEAQTFSLILWPSPWLLSFVLSELQFMFCHWLHLQETIVWRDFIIWNLKVLSLKSQNKPEPWIIKTIPWTPDVIECWH